MAKDWCARPIDLTRDRQHEPVRLISRLHGPRAYRVGESLREGRAGWEPDAIYNLDREGHSLTIIESSPPRERIEAIARNPVELALVVESPLIILLCRFGEDCPWLSVPYAWPLRQHGRVVQIVPPARLPGDGGALLWVSLVDADSGTILAQRGTPMTREFTAGLHGAIRGQVRGQFAPDSYVAAVRAVYECPIPPWILLERANVHMRLS